MPIPKAPVGRSTPGQGHVWFSNLHPHTQVGPKDMALKGVHMNPPVTTCA